MQIPPALVLGCNTPHGIGVLSDWIEEQMGYQPDFGLTGWSVESADGVGRTFSSAFGDGSGYGSNCGSANGSGYGYGYGYGFGYDNGFGNGGIT